MSSFKVRRSLLLLKTMLAKLLSCFPLHGLLLGQPIAFLNDISKTPSRAKFCTPQPPIQWHTWSRDTCLLAQKFQPARPKRTLLSLISLIAVVHNQMRGLSPRQPPQTLWSWLQMAASTMEVDNMVPSDSMSSAFTRIWEKRGGSRTMIMDSTRHSQQTFTTCLGPSLSVFLLFQHIQFTNRW